jgi:pyruvate/2-oxoglutarate/acetoin dehydrogenase E1 component
MGQDIAEYGGAFKITDGFVAQFGRNEWLILYLWEHSCFSRSGFVY